MTSPLDYLRLYAKAKYEFVYIWNVIFNRNFLNANKLRFHENCYINEDREFILKSLASSHTVSFVNEILYTHVHHAKQQTFTERALRISPKNLPQARLAHFRTARYIIRRVQDPKIRNFTLAFHVNDPMLRYFTLLARAGEKELYRKSIKFFKHRKAREIMFFGAKFLIRKPELFLKSIMLIYFPNLYFTLRQKIL